MTTREVLLHFLHNVLSPTIRPAALSTWHPKFYSTTAQSLKVMTITNTRHFLIVGLGNYTDPRTRHSVGQVVLDALAERFQTSLEYERQVMGWTGEIELDVTPRKKTKAKASPDYTSQLEPERVRFTFLKPKLLMNISGKSVGAALRTKIKPATNRSVIVIQDSLEHKPFRVSPKSGGSANGHNGVRSTIEALGGQDFCRIRIGIGRGGQDAGDYVLEGLSPKELSYWSDPEGDGVSEVWDAIQNIVSSSA